MTARLLCHSSSTRENNFDLLRFCFASLVLLSHCYLLASGSYRDEPLYALSHGYLNLGVLAVMGFFTLSGYLICQSWERTASAGDFLKKRVLRIYPGFIGVSLFCLLVVGPLGRAHLGDYLPGISLSRSLLRMLLLAEPHVPGVFANNPFPGTLDGSLWSLRYEFLCYFAVMALGLSGLLLRRGWMTAICAVCWLGHACQIVQYHFGPQLDRAGLSFPLLEHLGSSLDKPFYCGLYFFSGVVYYQQRDRIVRSPLLAVLAIALLLLSLSAPILLILFMPLCGVYLLFYFAFHPSLRLHDFAARGDLSYGLYLYGFPVQQLLVYWSGGRLHPLTLFAGGFPLTLCFAGMSWVGIERPFLRRKRLRREPIRQTPLPPEENAVV